MRMDQQLQRKRRYGQQLDLGGEIQSRADQRNPIPRILHQHQRTTLFARDGAVRRGKIQTLVVGRQQPERFPAQRAVPIDVVVYHCLFGQQLARNHLHLVGRAFQPDSFGVYRQSIRCFLAIGSWPLAAIDIAEFLQQPLDWIGPIRDRTNDKIELPLPR